MRLCNYCTIFTTCRRNCHSAYQMRTRCVKYAMTVIGVRSDRQRYVWQSLIKFGQTL